MHFKYTCVWIYITYMHTKFTIYVITYGHAESVCVYVCIYIYTFVRHVHVYACMFTYMHAESRVCMYNFTCTHTDFHVCGYILHIYTPRLQYM